VPSPAATEAQQHQAQITIDTYKLDRITLKKERRKALKDFHREGLDGLNHYRFIAELLA
jgi:hypothetical protein